MSPAKFSISYVFNRLDEIRRNIDNDYQPYLITHNLGNEETNEATQRYLEIKNGLDLFYEIKKNYNEIKFILENPKLYRRNQLDEIRNQIVIECHVFLNGSNLDNESKEKVIQQQLEMIDKVYLFEKQCPENLEFNSDKLIFAEIQSEFLIHLNLYNKESLFQIKKGLSCLLFNLKSKLFNKRGIIFFDFLNFFEIEHLNPRQDYEELMDTGLPNPQTESEEPMDLDLPNQLSGNKESKSFTVIFGNLVIIEDNFLQKIGKFYEKPKDLTCDWFFEFYKIDVMKETVRGKTNDGKNFS